LSLVLNSTPLRPGTSASQPQGSLPETIPALDPLVAIVDKDTLLSDQQLKQLYGDANPPKTVTDIYTITAQAGALLFNNPTGTLVQGQKIIIRIKDNGTARALTYGANFRASSDLALPSTTVVSKTLYMASYTTLQTPSGIY